MSLIIICVAGPGSTGKSKIIREFTYRYLGYRRERGDVRGIFQMPYLGYAVGISGSGDNLNAIREGQRFLSGYDDLRVMIVASQRSGKTHEEIKKIARRRGAKLAFIWTSKLRNQDRDEAIEAKADEIRSKMP